MGADRLPSALGLMDGDGRATRSDRGDAALLAVGPGTPVFRDDDAEAPAGADAADDGAPGAETATEPDEEDALDRLRGASPGPGAASITAVELEALLFVAERPLTRREITQLAGVDAETVDARLGDLEVQLRERGIRLMAVGERVQIATAPEAGALIGRYVGAEGLKLTNAALETLAIVAYRQPVTRGVIERIRGVDSDYVLRSLLHRRLVAEQGRADTPGRPILYGTGFEFLERFGLTSLDDLPPLDAEIAARLTAEDLTAQDAAAADETTDPPEVDGGA
jgi:segregation and condensation protein B